MLGVATCVWNSSKMRPGPLSSWPVRLTTITRRGPLSTVCPALFFNSQGEMTGEVRGAIENARALNPDEVTRWGCWVFPLSAGNYQQAIRFWEHIVEVAPITPNWPQPAGISEAYQRLGQEPPQPETAQASGPGVTVRVELSAPSQNRSRMTPRCSCSPAVPTARTGCPAWPA